MKTLRSRMSVLLFVAMLSISGTDLYAQSSATSDDESRGFTFYEQFQGSSNALGQVMKSDTSVGYNFNDYFGVDAGLPVYFVRASSSSTAAGMQSGTGIGNVYADLRLTYLNPVVNYASTLTGTAPTGDKSMGLSTGRATFDWNNRFDKGFGPFRPFVNAGIANTISDTPFFTRPFTTLGLVSHFEGGATYRIIRGLHVGASAYDYLPTGQQKVFSRLRGKNSTSFSGMGRSHAGVFENSSETIGNADIARDNGASAWVDATPIRYLILEAGYTRSVHFDLNTFSFGVGINLGSLVKAARGF